MTIEEFKALTEYQKEVFVTKEEFSALRNEVRELITLVDDNSQFVDSFYLSVFINSYSEIVV